jgi:hypothetical protein
MKKRTKKPAKNPNGMVTASQPQTPEEKRLIFADLPPEVERINVQTPDGRNRWKDVGDVNDEDIIIFTSKNKPNVMKARPGGRRPKPGFVAANPKIQQAMDTREEFKKRDPLLKATKKKWTSGDVLHETANRFAEVAADIRYERQVAHANNEPVSMIARREVTALVALRDSVFKHQDLKLKRQEIDLDSLAFRNLFVHIVTTFQDALLESGVPANEVGDVLTRFAKKVEGEEWRARADKAVRGGTDAHSVH